jgi:hypothetical protein
MSTRRATIKHLSATGVAADPEFAAELTELLSALRAITARLAAVIEPQPIEAARWLTTSEAAKLAHIGCTQSVRNWAREYGIGLKVRDRWQIDRYLLKEFLCDRAQSAGDTPAARVDHGRPAGAVET